MEACFTISLRSCTLSPWHLHHHRSILPPRHRLPSLCCCSSADGLHQPLHHHPPAQHSSFLTDWALPYSDPGWSFPESQPNSNKIADWVKVGGAIFLSIGFALGARSMYLKKDVGKEFAAPLPVQEHLISSSAPSDSSETTENAESSSLILGSIEVNEREYVKWDNERHTTGFLSKIPQEDCTSGQVSLSTKDVDDSNGNERSFIVSSVVEIEPREKDNVSSENCSLGTATADSSVYLPPTPDTVLEEGVPSHSIESFVKGNWVAMEVSDDISVFPAVPNVVVFDGEDVTPEALFPPPDSSATILSTLGTSGIAIPNKSDLSVLSFEEKVIGEGEILGELPCNLNDFSSGSVDKDILLPLEAMKLQKPAMPDTSLHDDVEGVQNVTHPKPFGSFTEVNQQAKKFGELHEWDVKIADVGPSASALEPEHQHFSPTNFPPPSAPSAALQKVMGRVVVPALIDHMQEQAFAALQALKVIEAGIEPGAICTRREYARWLIKASATLSRSPAHKVFPAMYVENASTLAYDDVLPEDLDFPSIQGLAEAGLISSRLLTHDTHNEKGSDQVPNDSNNTVFLPDSPLTRQDLITWKMALERQPSTMPVGKEALRELSGFIDLDKVHQDAWPSLAADVSSGERSIMSLAFGYTRRFQPEKPVTKAQAAIALATYEAWECISEEVARLEADSIAEAAVAAELALETKAKQEVAAAYDELLGAEREKQDATASMAETIRAELEKLKAEREEERGFLLKERAALDSEKVFVTMLRHEVEEQALALSSAKLEVAFEREQAEKFRREAEEERQTISKVRSELEIEKNALSLARVWAEDEARMAFGHAKALEQARNRWEDQVVQMQVDKEFDETTVARPSWHSEEVQSQKAALKGLVTKSRDFVKLVLDSLVSFWQFIQMFFVDIRNKLIRIMGKFGENIHEVRVNSIKSASKTVEGIQQTVSSSAAGLASGVREGTRKVVDEWRGGAERLSRKFKIS